MKILTMTLNPAFDAHYYMERFEPYKENYVTSSRREAGGKGVNIARALTANGVENEAFVVLGSENGAEFSAALAADGLNCTEFYTPGRIRENITLHAPGVPETRVSFDHFRLHPAVFDVLADTLLQKCGKDTVVTFTGRVPQGVELSRVTAFLQQIKKSGALLAVDSNSFDAAQLLSLHPWLIKPNEQETQALTGGAVQTPEDALRAAAELHLGGIAHVLISLGGQGAVYAGEGGAFHARAPEITPVSTIGAGDSMIAGFLAATASRRTAQECVRTALAYGSAACLTEGTRPPCPEDIKNLLNKKTDG